MKLRMFGVVAICCVVICALLYYHSARSKDPIVACYLEGQLSKTIALIEAQNSDAEHLLLAASCYRQLGLNSEFHRLVAQAQSRGASTESVQLAIAMERIQRGQLDHPAEVLVQILSDAGALDSDARSVVIEGALATKRFSEVAQVLENWRSQQPESPELAYLSAILLNLQNSPQAAESILIATIDKFPGHERSWLALADVLTRPPSVRFRHSQFVLERFVTRFPNSVAGRLKLASTRRRLGNAELSLNDLDSAVRPAELLEKSRLEFELGDYPAASATLKTLSLATQEDLQRQIDLTFQMSMDGKADAASELASLVRWCATALGLGGQQTTSLFALDLAEDRVARLRRLQDLTVRQATTSLPSPMKSTRGADRILTETGADLRQEMDSVSSLTAVPRIRYWPTDEAARALPGFALYQENCESCHGRNGDGKGRAAANLFPPARNFRDEPMRMVSTENRLASDVDLMQTIRNGLPGTSMASFARLSEFEIYSIIEVLRQFVIDGLGQQYKREIEVRGDDLNIDSQSSWMEARATPSQPIVVPMFDLTANLIEQGKGVFERSGCGGCHRTSQEDSGSRLRLFDSIGRPILAPNLAQDTFHRGASGAEIYKRIALGIPGTPHPALSSEKADELTSIVAYILSCRSVPTKPTTNYDRSPAGSR